MFTLHDCVSKRFFLLLEKGDIHGYPETLSIEVQPTTGQPFSCSLKDLQHSCDIQRDSGREVRVMMGDIIITQSSFRRFLCKH